jgi:hypothetical protein
MKVDKVLHRLEASSLSLEHWSGEYLSRRMQSDNLEFITSHVKSGHTVFTSGTNEEHDVIHGDESQAKTRLANDNDSDQVRDINMADVEKSGCSGPRKRARQHFDDEVIWIDDESCSGVGYLEDDTPEISRPLNKSENEIKLDSTEEQRFDCGLQHDMEAAGDAEEDEEGDIGVELHGEHGEVLVKALVPGGSLCLSGAAVTPGMRVVSVDGRCAHVTAAAACELARRAGSP